MKFGLFSVSYAGTWGNCLLSLEEFVEGAAELGFDGVLIMGKRPHASPLDLDTARRAALRDRIQELGLEALGVAAYTDFTIGHDQAGTPISEIQMLYVDQCIRLAHDLEAPFVRVFTGFERPGLPFEEAWIRCRDSIRECGERARELGVTLVVQNHHDIANRPTELERFLDDVALENVCAGFDAWAPSVQGCTTAELQDAAARIAPRVGYTIVADYERRERVRYHEQLINYEALPDAITAVPVGDGFIEYEAFLDGMHRGGFDGYIVYEMCSPIRGGGGRENLDSCAAHFLRWARSIAASFVEKPLSASA